MALSKTNNRLLPSHAIRHLSSGASSKTTLWSVLHNGRGLFFLGGFFLGGSGLSGAVVLKWNQDAAAPPSESKAERRQRKLEEKLAAEDDIASCSGLVKRWLSFAESWWPRWKLCEAEVRSSLLLLRSAHAGDATSAVTFHNGPRCAAVPLGGATVVCATTAAAPFELVLTTGSGETEHLRLPSAELLQRWQAALQGSKATKRVRRVVDVAYPPSWEAPLAQRRLVPLERSSAEFQRVEKLALSQQFSGSGTYVKGKLKVKTIQRVQAPHVWEAYAMRRAIISAENDGDPEERLLWHGTTVPHLILRDGFDPRVCSLDGMFGGGVYFADKSTKSLRYAGASKPGDTGTLLLCRVALGRPMLKRFPQSNMRRPPDPLPLFGWEHFTMWLEGRKFHSVFGCAGVTLLMNEYIVYHTNQGYPEYVLEFELV